jgi:hypothetical protein
MYEAASQAGGGRVQGQARQRRQTPVLEEERGEMRYAPEDGMDSEGREGADLLWTESLQVRAAAESMQGTREARRRGMKQRYGAHVQSTRRRSRE